MHDRISCQWYSECYDYTLDVDAWSQWKPIFISWKKCPRGRLSTPGKGGMFNLAQSPSEALQVLVAEVDFRSFGSLICG